MSYEIWVSIEATAYSQLLKANSLIKFINKQSK
jgi:hypothetical protein